MRIKIKTVYLPLDEYDLVIKNSRLMLYKGMEPQMTVSLSMDGDEVHIKSYSENKGIFQALQHIFCEVYEAPVGPFDAEAYVCRIKPDIYKQLGE